LGHVIAESQGATSPRNRRPALALCAQGLGKIADRLDAEKQSIVAASSTDDAQEGTSALIAKRRLQFRSG
jgi:hypothetical protein